MTYSLLKNLMMQVLLSKNKNLKKIKNLSKKYRKIDQFRLKRITIRYAMRIVIKMNRKTQI